LAQVIKQGAQKLLISKFFPLANVVQSQQILGSVGCSSYIDVLVFLYHNSYACDVEHNER